MSEVNHELIGETFVDGFRQCLYRGDAIGKNAPELLKRILKDGYWKRPDKSGKPFTHVEHFITASPLPGLGSDVATIKQVCHEDKEALDMLDKALEATERRGRPEKINNNIIDLDPCPQGTSKQRAIRTLRKKRPDLHTKVMTGELTPHRAMIEAGLRDETITIPNDPLKASRRLLKHFSGDTLTTLLTELANHAGYELIPRE